MKRNIRVKLLHFTEGIDQLGGRMAVSNGAMAGSPSASIAQSIERIPGGYLVGWMDRLFVVSESRVKVAEVEDLDVMPQRAPAPADTATPAPESAAEVSVTPAPVLTVGDGVVMDAHGVYSRVVTEPPPSEEPNGDSLAREYKPKHRRQGPTPSEK